MKKLNLLVVGATLIGLTLITAGCVGLVEKGMESAKFGPENATARVLVAAVDSDYKRALVKAIADDLAAVAVGTDVVPLDQFETARAAREYRAWVLVGTIRAGTEDARIQKARKDHPDDAHLQVLNTKGGPGENTAVDTTTAASGASASEVVKPLLDKLKAMP